MLEEIFRGKLPDLHGAPRPSSNDRSSRSEALNPLRLFQPLVRVYRDAFEGLPRDAWWLALVAFINRAGLMVLPFISLYVVRQMGLPASSAGIVLLSFGLGSVVGSVFGGRLCARIGALRLQLVSLLAGGVGYIALSTLDSMATLVPAVFVVSSISDAYRPAAMVAMVEVSPLPVRTRALSLMRLAMHLGLTVGPAVGGLLASVDYKLLFWGDGLTCIAAGMVLYRVLPPRPRRLRGVGAGETDGADKASAGEKAAAADSAPQKIPAAWEPLFDKPLLAFMSMVFVMACVMFQFAGSLPLYLTTVYAFSERGVGLLFAFKSFLTVLFEMVLVRAFEHSNPMRMFGLGSFFLCGSFALLALPEPAWLAVVMMGLWSLGEMLAMPFSNILVVSRAPEGQSGAAMGLYTGVFSCAMVVAPPVGLWIFDYFEPIGGQVLWLAAGAMGPLLWVAARLLAPRWVRQDVAVSTVSGDSESGA